MLTFLAPRNGWHAAPQTDRHVLFDELRIRGQTVATVEAFDDEGPYYANAITPAGEGRRSGAVTGLPEARDWCERAAGLKSASS